MYKIMGEDYNGNVTCLEKRTTLEQAQEAFKWWKDHNFCKRVWIQ